MFSFHKTLALKGFIQMYLHVTFGVLIKNLSKYKVYLLFLLNIVIYLLATVGNCLNLR